MSDVKDVEAKLYYSVPELAASLNVSRMTIYRLIEGNGIEAIRIGRSIRIAHKEYERVMAEGAE